MNWSELPTKLRIFLVLLPCAATPVFLWSMWTLRSRSHDSDWIILAIFTLATIPFFRFLPSTSTTVSVGDTYAMAIAMLYGVTPCVVTTFLYSLSTSLLAQRPRVYLYKIAFNTSSMVLVSWLYGSAYHMVRGNNTHPLNIVFAAAIMLAVFFFTNSILTSIAISWAVTKKTFDFWTQTCFPLFLDFSASAGAAVFIALSGNMSRYAPVIVAPIVALIWGYQKLIQSRAAEVTRHFAELEQLHMRTVESLAMAVDAKDQTTYGHIRRVHAYAVGLARLHGIREKSNEFKAIETGALLHDIGKLAVDDYILNKPGRLTEKEYEKIKIHALAGDEILRQVVFPFPVALYVRHHHERWDGSGYPDGLKGEEIPLGARILTVADSFDAICQSRPYKPPIPTDQAIDILCREAGRFFDPELVRLMQEHIDELEEAAMHEVANATELSFRRHDGGELESISQISANSEEINEDIPERLQRLSERCFAMAGVFDLADILPMFLYQTGNAVPFDTSVLYLENNGVEITAACVVGKFSNILTGHRIEMGQGGSGWTAAYGLPILNSDPSFDFRGLPHDLSTLKTSLIVPVIHAGSVHGTLSLYNVTPMFYTERHLDIIQKLTASIASLIATAKPPEEFPDTDDAGGEWTDFLSGYGPHP